MHQPECVGLELTGEVEAVEDEEALYMPEHTHRVKGETGNMEATEERRGEGAQSLRFKLEG